MEGGRLETGNLRSGKGGHDQRQDLHLPVEDHQYREDRARGQALPEGPVVDERKVRRTRHRAAVARAGSLVVDTLMASDSRAVSGRRGS